MGGGKETLARAIVKSSFICKSNHITITRNMPSLHCIAARVPSPLLTATAKLWKQLSSLGARTLSSSLLPSSYAFSLSYIIRFHSPTRPLLYFLSSTCCGLEWSQDGALLAMIQDKTRECMFVMVNRYPFCAGIEPWLGKVYYWSLTSILSQSHS